MRLPFPVRRVLAPMAARIPVRIRSGPNAGALWSLAAAGRHRSGTFEPDRVEAILGLLRRGDCLWDLGAHHGYVALAASGAVGRQGHVYALEPSTYNFSLLRRHVEWNGRTNVTPLNVGVAATPGRLPFGGGGSSQTFRIGGGSALCEFTSIEEMAASGFQPPDLVKIDVEGAEGPIVEAGAEHLPPTAAVMVSVHSGEAYDRCVSALEQVGFAVHASEAAWRLRNSATWGEDDPDVIAVGPEREDLAAPVERLPGFAPA